MEKYVCNLELAKKLKELGVKQESHFYWEERNNPVEWILTRKEEITPEVLGNVSAFTVGELGEMLPYRLRLPNSDCWLRIEKLKHGDWDIRYHPNKIKEIKNMTIIQADTEANARAKMLIYLKENKLI